MLRPSFVFAFVVLLFFTVYAHAESDEKPNRRVDPNARVARKCGLEDLIKGTCIVAPAALAANNFTEPPGLIHFKKGYSYHKIDNPPLQRVSENYIFAFTVGESSEVMENKRGEMTTLPSQLYFDLIGSKCHHASEMDYHATYDYTIFQSEQSSSRTRGFDQETELNLQAGPVGASTTIRNAAVFSSSQSSQYMESSSSASIKQATVVEATNWDYSASWKGEPTKADLQQSFITDAMTLIQTEYADSQNVREFIDRYGTHYVKGADIGSYIQATMAFEMTYSSSEVHAAVQEQTSQEFSLWFVSSSQGEETHEESTQGSQTVAAYQRSEINAVGSSDFSDFNGFCNSYNKNPIPMKIHFGSMNQLLRLAGVNETMVDIFWRKASDIIFYSVRDSDMPDCVWEACPIGSTCSAIGCEMPWLVGNTLLQNGGQSVRFSEEDAGGSGTMWPLISKTCEDRDFCDHNKVEYRQETVFNMTGYTLRTLNDKEVSPELSDSNHAHIAQCSKGKIITLFQCVGGHDYCGVYTFTCQSPDPHYLWDVSTAVDPWVSGWMSDNGGTLRCPEGFAMTGFECETGHIFCGRQRIYCSEVNVKIQLETSNTKKSTESEEFHEEL